MYPVSGVRGSDLWPHMLDEISMPRISQTDEKVFIFWGLCFAVRSQNERVLIFHVNSLYVVLNQTLSWANLYVFKVDTFHKQQHCTYVYTCIPDETLYTCIYCQKQLNTFPGLI